jgi:hypothetical protein
MKCNRGTLIKALALCLVLSSFLPSIGQTAEIQPAKSEKQKFNDDKPVDLSRLQKPALWHDPGAIASLDLFYGQGGKGGQPTAPFKFDSEDLHGTNPKFDVHDASGAKWRVKLGDEARPEVVASRLLWAVGYFVEDDYVLPTADIENLQIQRGANLAKDGRIENARFARKPEGQKKIGTWRWKHNPFQGTREFNGLRVMMALMNNWDLKDENNAVFEDKKSGEDIFLTSDIGATFGTNGLSWSKDRSKGDADTFEKSRFISHKSDREVDFATPAPPNPITAPNVKQYEMRRGLEWIGKDIPIADAQWIGSLLRQLSHQQLVDAFRAGHFSTQDVDRYVSVIEGRIHELAAL